MQTLPHSPDAATPCLQVLHRDQAIIFGGMTLARLTGIPALMHRIMPNGWTRLSAPWFLRCSETVLLPATPGQEAETLHQYNRRIRMAEVDQMQQNGLVTAQAGDRCTPQSRFGSNPPWHNHDYGKTEYYAPYVSHRSHDRSSFGNHGRKDNARYGFRDDRCNYGRTRNVNARYGFHDDRCNYDRFIRREGDRRPVHNGGVN